MGADTVDDVTQIGKRINAAKLAAGHQAVDDSRSRAAAVTAGEEPVHERIHQSLGYIIEPQHALDDRAEVVCIERLGGLLKSYHRLAA